ncbi:DNA-directed RNA polymerase sigma-70 factor [Dactylosporangium sucinum]|uniref:DNA-directed RNA polymerase sigma-70 factor n=1 Tax=Dactylosporangium sucinum TaxID=1424081 RepID=A0A917TXT5_9ACTN|nr:DNA-directed RNA polymerase sigma-70 factor [Dactylosporangium sucinum]
MGIVNTAELEAHRAELTGYCYRMLGSAFDAEDAVQEAFVRAWRGSEQFEGRSSLRSWLYRIATNVCLTMLTSAQRRIRPMDLGPAGSGTATDPGEPRPEEIWVGPVPDDRVLPERADPADVVTGRESVRLAFVAALQHLPARQRAVLILREVLAWSAQEVAELLDTSVASVNSALQRARATLATADVTADVHRPLDDEQRALLGRYVKAFEAYDLEALTALLHEDATLSMPPLPLWLRGPADIRAWMAGTGSGCQGSRLVPVVANGMPAFGQYRTTGPWALIVLELSGGRIAGVNNFLDTARLFPLFGLPDHLD